MASRVLGLPIWNWRAKCGANGKKKNGNLGNEKGYAPLGLLIPFFIAAIQDLILKRLGQITRKLRDALKKEERPGRMASCWLDLPCPKKRDACEENHKIRVKLVLVLRR